MSSIPFLSICIFLTSSSAFAGSVSTETKWSQLYQDGQYLLNSEHYSEATSKFREALRVAEALGADETRVVMSLNALGAACASVGHFAEAERLYRRALTLTEALRGKQDPNYAAVIGELGELYLAQNMPDRAQKLLLRSLLIYERAVEGNKVAAKDAQLATIRNWLAETYLQQGAAKAADRMLQYVIPALEEGPRKAEALCNLAAAKSLEGSHEEAVKLLNAVIESVAGSEPLVLLRACNDLAVEYARAGFNDRADLLFRRSLAIAERHLLRNDREYASILMNYSALLRKMKHKDEAHQLAAQAEAMLHESAITNGTGMTVDVSELRHK